MDGVTATEGVMYRAADAPGLHPKLRDLLALWSAKRRGGYGFPQRCDIDVLELRPWMGNLILLEVRERGRDMLYRVYGTALADYFGRDLTGFLLSSLPPRVQTVVSAEYGRVIAECEPVAVTHRRSIQAVRLPMSKLILPLGTGPEAVDYLLAGLYRDA